jgi:hypothetical protein
MQIVRRVQKLKKAERLERDRLLIATRLTGSPYEDLAVQFGISVGRACQIFMRWARSQGRPHGRISTPEQSNEDLI